MSPSGNSNIHFGTGLFSSFNSSTFYYIEIRNSFYYNLESIGDYNSSYNAYTGKSSKTEIGVSAEFKINSIFIMPGLYRSFLNQKIYLEYREGDFIIRETEYATTRGISLSLSLGHPLMDGKIRPCIYFVKEWKTIPSLQMGISIKGVL